MSWSTDSDTFSLSDPACGRNSFRIYDPLTGDVDSILFGFLSMPLWTSNPVFERFMQLDHAIYRNDPVVSKERFIYVPGTRPDRALLVAHADTVFDEDCGHKSLEHTLYKSGDVIHGNGVPIGADDRAGCAMLWHLRNSGHSLLVLDGEELGGIGSHWLMDSNPEIADEINAHSFMIQLDRQNGTDFKTYDVGTESFRAFIAARSGYSDAGNDSCTDICTLCRDICGVNFSVGYYDPHTFRERLNCREWQQTYTMVSDLLAHPLPSFRL